MSAPGEGGRYVVDPNGTRVLTQRTNWTPPTKDDAEIAPEVEELLNPEIKDDDDGFVL